MKLGHLLVGLIAVVLHAECRSLAAQGSGRPPRLEELQKQVAVDSNDAALHLHLGRLLLEKNRHDEAERHFRQAAAIAPGRPEPYLGLAAVPFARGDGYWKKREKEQGREAVARAWTEAYKFQRLAFLIDPLVDPGLLPRVEERVTLRVEGMNYRVWWMLPLTKAMNAFRAGKYQDAKRRCDNLIKDAGEGSLGTSLPPTVLWVRALAHAHLDEFNLAATDFTVLMHAAVEAAQAGGVKTEPLTANDYRYMTAIMNFFTGQPEVASLLLREALTNDPSLYMAHSRLAAMLEKTGAWDEAVAERQRAIDANPENSELFLDLGLTLARANRPAPALEALNEAARLNPRDPLAPYHAGEMAQQLGRQDEARRYLERFLAIAPSSMTAELSQARQSLAALH